MSATGFDKFELESAVEVAKIATDMSADANDDELKTTLNALIDALKAVGVIK